jgi:hypothetical protein
MINPTQTQAAPFRTFPQNSGLKLGSLGRCFAASACRAIVDASLRRATQIERETAGPNLHDDASPEGLGIMRTGDDHLAGPADGELAVIDADRRKNENPKPMIRNTIARVMPLYLVAAYSGCK